MDEVKIDVLSRTYELEPPAAMSGMVVGMMYVPLQAWEEPYDDMTAFSRGTIFPSLDKPFLGQEGCPR